MRGGYPLNPLHTSVGSRLFHPVPQPSSSPPSQRNHYYHRLSVFLAIYTQVRADRNPFAPFYNSTGRSISYTFFCIFFSPHYLGKDSLSVQIEFTSLFMTVLNSIMGLLSSSLMKRHSDFRLFPILR